MPNTDLKPAKAQDEIDQIMNELEELQREVGAPRTGNSVVRSPEADKAESETKTEALDGDAEPEGDTDAKGGAHQDEEKTMSEDSSEGMVDEFNDLVDLTSKGFSEANPRKGRSALSSAEAKKTRSLLDEPEADSEPVEPASSGPSTGDEGSLSIQLSGNMKLTLCYEYDGQEVTIGFKNHTLMVDLSDGTEFRVPISKKRARAA